MPRANRYIVPGNIYHLNHRCHNREFLLKFARDRDAYRRRLREAVEEVNLSLLTYNITCNHVHLVACADDPEQIAIFMQQASGEFARDYNRRKQRSGAYWEGRYHATMIDSGQYLWECLNYVELNMVRCGMARHPREWKWSGYEELMGQRRRNRLLDVEKLLWLLRTNEIEEFRKHFDSSLQERIDKDQLKRESKWTDSIAVGSQSFVEQLKVRNRQQVQIVLEGGAWVLRESYESVLTGQNSAITTF